MSETMGAIVVDEEAEGRPLVWSQVARPEPGPGEVLVRTHATAVNRADLVQRTGRYPPPPGASPILGLEVAGVIEAAGEGVTSHEVGDRVCALLAGGGYAEYVAVPEETVMPIPEGLSMTQAAALPEVVCTAWVNLFMEAQAGEGDVVMIHAAASGVGTAAVQMCKARGLTVVATAGDSKRAYLEGLGADLVVGRHSEDFAARVVEVYGGVDVILCPVGADYLERNLSVLNTKGRMVLIGLLGGRAAEVDLGRLLVKRQRLIGSVLRARALEEKREIVAQVLANVWPMIARRELAPVIHEVVPLEEAERAHALIASNETIGKVVMTAS
jgi:putative PIG3 family NAD(P)H quinone oxidoreductase